MRDKQVFEKTVLPNGITVYYYPMDVGFVYGRLYVPIGHRNNTNGILPGTAHFLEHLVFNRSQVYREKRAFEKQLPPKGGDWNAVTDTYGTEFQLSIPSQHFDWMWERFFSHVCDPLFVEEDIAHERGIIADERNQRERYYPGKGELTKYLNTGFQYDMMVGLRQMYGNDEDLAAISTGTLENLHKYYFNKDTYVIIGGTLNPDIVYKNLASLHVNAGTDSLERQTTPLRWAKREYHEKCFRSTSRPDLYISGFLRDVSMIDRMTFNTIDMVMRDYTNGPIENWLRHELGTTYSTSFHTWLRTESVVWELNIKPPSKKYVNLIRNEWLPRLRESLTDKTYLEGMMSQIENERVFELQKLSEIIARANSSLQLYGYIQSENEVQQLIRDTGNPETLLRVADRFFAPSEVGEFCALPEEE